MTKEQWLAIRNRDKTYDGQFFYGLRTTKSVCKPSCPAKTCNPKNVIIFDTLEEAIAKGFHPCRRCRPDQPDWKGSKAELAEAAKARIEAHYTEKFCLEELAGALYVNKSYLVRVFRECTGSTLLTYHNQVRCREAEKLLQIPDLKISLVGNRVGYPSASHVTRIFHSLYGLTPTEYRNRYLRTLDEP